MLKQQKGSFLLMPAAIKYLGIDPGLRFTGWGVIEQSGSTLRHIADGTISSTASLSLAERLVEIEAGLSAVLAAHEPAHVAVEQAFVARDAAAALKLGQARGIALLVPSRAGLPVAEYAPNHIKKAVVGAGHADKAQIRLMVGMLLPGAQMKTEHAADALAIAICHAHSGTGNDRLAAALQKAGA